MGVHIMYKITRSAIISLSFLLLLPVQIYGFYANFTNDENQDGVIKSALSNRCSDQILSKNFIKRDNTISESKNLDVAQGRHTYTVQSMPCLKQIQDGPCGFYSIFHLSQMHHNKNLLDRQKLTNEFRREIYYNTSKTKSMYNYIEQHTPYFNPTENFTIISNKKSNIMPGERDNLPILIRKFQTEGTPQYLVVHTNCNTPISDITLSWDNRNDRLACIENHWIAVKIEWQGREGQSPVIISIADSGSSKDNRFTYLAHWFYHKFVHEYNFYNPDTSVHPITATITAQSPSRLSQTSRPHAQQRQRRTTTHQPATRTVRANRKKIPNFSAAALVQMQKTRHRIQRKSIRQTCENKNQSQPAIERPNTHSKAQRKSTSPAPIRKIVKRPARNTITREVPTLPMAHFFSTTNNRSQTLWTFLKDKFYFFYNDIRPSITDYLSSTLASITLFLTHIGNEYYKKTAILKDLD